MSNLSPMEKALLQSLQDSNLQQEKRLSELERLLSELLTHSETESDSGQKSLRDLDRAVKDLAQQVDGLDCRIAKFEADMNQFGKTLGEASVVWNQSQQAYNKAVTSFNLMRQEVQNYSAESNVLRSQIEQLVSLIEE